MWTTKYCNELGQQNIKTSNINMNTKNVYCKSIVRNLVEFTSYTRMQQGLIHRISYPPFEQLTPEVATLIKTKIAGNFKTDSNMERTREATYQRKYREKLNQINKTNAAFTQFAEIWA